MLCSLFVSIRVEMPLFICKVPFTKGVCSFSPVYRAVDWAVAKRSRNTIRCEGSAPYGTGVVGE